MRLSDLFLYHTSTLQAAYYLQLVARLRLSIRSQGEWPIDWHPDSKSKNAQEGDCSHKYAFLICSEFLLNSSYGDIYTCTCKFNYVQL